MNGWHFDSKLLEDEVQSRGIETQRYSPVVFSFNGIAMKWTTSNSWGGVQICKNKSWTYDILQKAGVPTPGGRVINKDAFRSLQSTDISFPCAVKPMDSTGSIGVTLDINNWPEARKAIERAFISSAYVIIEPYVSGPKYRVLVVGNSVAGVLRHDRPLVIGDGKSSISDLVKMHNQNVPGLGTKSIVDREYLKSTGRGLSTVPSHGEEVWLHNVANPGFGGGSHEAVFEMTPEMEEQSVAAVQAIPGIDIGGIDLILGEDGPVIIEVNSAPRIGGHHVPWSGRSINVAKKIVDFYLQ